MSYRKKVKRRINKKKIILKVLHSIILLFVISLFIIQYKKNVSIHQQKLEQMQQFDESLSNIKNTEYKTYYVSANGTSKDGTDINNPMSLAEANKKTYYGNEKILFKCGDTFYGTINFNVEASEEEMFYIGSYGEGEKPIISGANILINKDAWKIDEDGIYRLDLSEYSNFEGIGKTYWGAYNIGFIADEQGNIYGARKETKEELENEYEFYCENNYFYIKSDKNPNDKLGNIKIIPRNNLVKVSSNTIINGLNIQYTGAHGIVKKNEELNNVYIHDCIMQNIGGSVQFESSFIRYGNAIEFWNQGENILVENCIIRNTYDSGFTFQGTSVTTGFENIVARNNIFINCTYSVEIFCRNDSLGDDSIEIGISKCDVTNNLSINQGKGWGYEVRPNKYIVGELVTWSLPKSKTNFVVKNNTYYNSRNIRYYSSNEKNNNALKNDVEVDNNAIYLSKNTTFINSEGNYEDRSILAEYNQEQNSTFRLLSDNEIEQISNPEILNSNNYNEIKTYYENLEKEFAYTDNINKIAEKYAEFEEKYTQQLSNIEGLQEQVNKIKENIQSTNISTDRKYIIQQLEQTYKIGTKLINNNCENLENMLKSIEEIGKSYKEIINTENNTETEVDTSDIENQFIALNNLLEDNNDLDIEFVLKLKSLLTEYYNNIQTTQGYEKEYNYISTKYLIEYANIILNNKITEYIENNPVTVSYSATSLTKQDVTVTLNIPQDVKITNNEGNNTYTFTENGTFTFEYERRGKTDSEIVSVNYIDKTSPEITNVENGEGYTQSVSPNVSDEHLDKVQLTFKGQVIEDYEIGDELTEEGEYKLTATDTVGNTSTVKFYIMKEDSTLKISNSYILNINPETTTKSFMEKFTVIEGYTIKHEDIELSEGDTISTGDILEETDGNKFTLIVRGDLNCDGRLSIVDLSIERKYLLEIIEIDEVKKMSSDMNIDEETSLVDISIMRKTILGIIE